MIQILITGGLILLFLKIVDKENFLDFYDSIAIYICPLIFSAVCNLLIQKLELPQLLSLISVLGYFVIPFLLFGAISAYTAKKKALLSLGIAVIAGFTESTSVVITQGQQVTTL
ncbi:hypothetical protein [Pseudoalteromonas ardens]|uniref:Uncharacterized protein n=1 Tax=Pseudoalteromonas rubra TaxID=43658 RepID=A0A0L0ET56_9GAMM|nr:hypothetical protein [Pseudoalteromonas sp. R96]KNC67594.1 hypothetical protein AC626_09845 [Pseudoalteromonas rubra]MDK1311317.1 hypothetical protein [Pseudoalteromonas sp. R96]